MRVWVGFGLGNGEIRAVIEGRQGGRVLAKAQIKTSAGHKPGLLVPVAGQAAAGSAIAASATAGAAGAATGASEAFMATVESDAHRVAKAVSKKVVQSYINRGWLPPMR